MIEPEKEFEEWLRNRNEAWDKSIEMVIPLRESWLASHTKDVERIEKLREELRLIHRECSLCKSYESLPGRIQELVEKLLKETE